MQRPDSTTELERAPTESQQSKTRRITFRVVLTLFALLVLAMNVFAVLEPIFMWFPAETVAEMFDEESSFVTMHRAHFMAVGLIGWAVVLSTLVQLRKPARRVAPMMLLVGVATGAMIVYGLSGTFGEWLLEEIASVVLPLSLVVLLHPSRDRMLRKPEFDRPLGVMAALATLPWLVYIVDNAWSQFTNAAGDPHAEMEHWGTAALLGILIVVGAFLGSSDHGGWRLTAWIAGGASVVFGLHSLVFPGLASALPTFWAGAAILWGIGFLLLAVKRARSGASSSAEAAQASAS
jgi:hypothetical protein